MLELSEKVFDEYAEEYDRWYDEHKEEFEKEVACFRRIVDAPKPWLEIGVGSGRFARALGIEYGVDPAGRMVNIAIKRGIATWQAKGEELPFPNNFFGAVFIIVTLCFVDNPIAILKEANRVLREGGKLYLGIIPRDSELGKDYMEKGKEGHKFYSVAKFYTIEEVKEMLSKTGFEVTKIEKANLEKPDFVCIEAKKISS